MKKLDPNTGIDSRLLQLSKWWSANPSHVAGLGSQKGQIAKGFDADFVVRYDTQIHLRLNIQHLKMLLAAGASCICSLHIN